MYVCLCHAVTDRQIKQAVRDGVGSLRQIQLCLRVGTNCGKCISSAREIVDAAQQDACERPATVSTPRLTLVSAR